MRPMLRPERCTAPQHSAAAQHALTSQRQHEEHGPAGRGEPDDPELAEGGLVRQRPLAASLEECDAAARVVRPGRGGTAGGAARLPRVLGEL
jgi:hypothetical protein